MYLRDVHGLTWEVYDTLSTVMLVDNVQGQNEHVLLQLISDIVGELALFQYGNDKIQNTNTYASNSK